MACSGVRKVVAACGMSALAVIAAACSGGTGRVNASPESTRPSGNSSRTSTSSSARRSTKPKTKAKRAATTPTTKRATVSSIAGSTTTPPSGTLVVPLVLPSSPNAIMTSPTVATTPGTSKPTPATIPRPRPYDPSKPIDLGGEPGVTPAEQARAEQLVRDTLRDLPKYASVATAYADGYRSIGDAITGDEHYVK